MSPCLVFFFNDPAPTEIYTLSLHDALPISMRYLIVTTAVPVPVMKAAVALSTTMAALRSEEHTSELQSHVNLVCRLLLEKKKAKRVRRDQSPNAMKSSRAMTSMAANVQNSP